MFVTSSAQRKMAPNVADLNGVLFESDAATPDMALPYAPIQEAKSYPRQYVWRNIALFVYLHLAALYGGFLFLTSAKWQTDVFGKFENFSVVCIKCVRNLLWQYTTKRIHVINVCFYFVCNKTIIALCSFCALSLHAQ